MIDLSFVTPLIELVTVIILGINVWLTLDRNREVKSMDVAIGCQHRYMDTVFDAKMLVKEGKVKGEDYYLKFWNLQIDQFQYWTLGYIETEIYRYWMQCRHRESERNETLGGISYDAGWKLAQEQLCPPPAFVEFMTKVFHGDLEVALAGKNQARANMYAR